MKSYSFMFSGRNSDQGMSLYAVLRDQNKTRGKIRLTNMLKSGKELKLFAVRDQDLAKFCEEAKKYGVLYCVLKDANADDGLTDIMVRAEDTSKINRIFERFGLAVAEMCTVKTAIEQKKEVPLDITGGDREAPERVQTADDKLEQFMDRVTEPKENPTAEKAETANHTMARTGKSRQSEPSSASRKPRSEDAGERSISNRPSVRKEMEEIRAEQILEVLKSKHVHIVSKIDEDIAQVQNAYLELLRTQLDSIVRIVPQTPVNASSRRIEP